MRNLLEDIGLPRGSDEPRLASTLDAAEASTHEVLGAPLRRTHYERMHLQYQAIAAAADVLRLAGTLDHHRWRDRVVEFD